MRLKCGVCGSNLRPENRELDLGGEREVIPCGWVCLNCNSKKGCRRVGSEITRKIFTVVAQTYGTKSFKSIQKQVMKEECAPEIFGLSAMQVIVDDVNHLWSRLEFVSDTQEWRAIEDEE